jgi:uncharacterized membrane protein (UPF0127 family)
VVLAACADDDRAVDPTASTVPVTSDESVPAAVGETVAETVTEAVVTTVADPVLITHPAVVTRSPEAVGDGVQPDGFTTVTARVTAADGTVCDVCLWLADDGDERSRGLMGVNDLGDAVGMAFVWETPIDGEFYMLNTPTPLSIAWFEPSGVFLSETDMEPCITDDSATCERYGAGGSYDLAIEMFDGQLGTVGIGPGSQVELLPGSESAECALQP